MILGVYCWFDKVDKVYMPDSFVLDRSRRSVCRGYLQSFNQHKMMNPKEFSLCKTADFDDETGELKPIFPPEVVDPMIVFDKEDLSDNKEHDL